MSRSILSLFGLSTSPASSLSTCCRQYWVWRMCCHKAAKGSSWKGSGLCGLIPQILLSSVSGVGTGESSEPPWGAAEQEGLRVVGGCVPVQDGFMQVCSLLVTVWVILWERFFKGVLKIIINCPFGNTSISYLPMDLLTNSVIRAFWKLAEPHLLRDWKEKISLLSTQQLKNSHEWQLWGQQQ